MIIPISVFHEIFLSLAVLAACPLKIHPSGWKGCLSRKVLKMHSRLIKRSRIVIVAHSFRLIFFFFISIGRPMKMSTDEYGKLWLSISNEVKQNLKVAPSQGTLPMMLDVLQQKLKLHIVDIIGT